MNTADPEPDGDLAGQLAELGNAGFRVAAPDAPPDAPPGPAVRPEDVFFPLADGAARPRARAMAEAAEDRLARELALYNQALRREDPA